MVFYYLHNMLPYKGIWFCCHLPPLTGCPHRIKSVQTAYQDRRLCLLTESYGSRTLWPRPTLMEHLMLSLRNSFAKRTASSTVFPRASPAATAEGHGTPPPPGRPPPSP